MEPPFDSSETSLTIEHDRGIVTVYTTRKDLYEGLLGLTKPPVYHTDLRPGYELVYRESDIKNILEIVK